MVAADTPTAWDVRRWVANKVRDSLPNDWRVTDTGALRDGQRPDLEIQIDAPDGRSVRLVVEIKQVLERRDVPRVGDQMRRLTTNTTDIPVVGARYLSTSVREALSEEGLAYVDATGNMRIAASSPAFFISGQGDDRDPWRKGRPRGTLKGEPAARVARALLDYNHPWRVRELITASGASSGATYRVLDYLQREDLVTKSGDYYSVTEWERLLRQWSADAPFKDAARVMAFIEPRGMDAFLGKLTQDLSFPVAVTGSAAAREWASYAPAKAAYVYVSSIQEAAQKWGLRANAAAPNVILLEPASVGDVPFRNATQSSLGYPVAAPAQVAADLLNGPGREPSEGEFLIEWMKVNEERWRRG